MHGAGRGVVRLNLDPPVYIYMEGSSKSTEPIEGYSESTEPIDAVNNFASCDIRTHDLDNSA